MDLLDSLVNKCILSQTSILSLIDDYTMFCYYTKPDLVFNQAILSPLRLSKADTLPSFNIYPADDGSIRYYDHGTGEGGNIFHFVKVLHGFETYKEALQKINLDFGLGFEDVPFTFEANKVNFLKAGIPASKIPILDVLANPDFSKEGYQYWNSYHIDKAILDEYHVNEIRGVILEDRSIVRIKSLAFSYRIGEKFKIYQPFEKELKFRNNFPREYVEGYYQLVNRPVKSPIVFITKSLKDVMVFRKLNLDAVAPKGENMTIPDFIIEKLIEIYPYIFILFDNDPAGIKGSSRYEKYNLPVRFVPLSPGVKDVSDHIKMYGILKTKSMLKTLVT